MGAAVEVQLRAGGDSWTRSATAHPRVAANEILEVAVPFADLGLAPNSPFAFFVTVHNRTSELERHPAHRPVESSVPEAAFDDVNWKA